jgi:hypothetical protein
MNHDEVRAVIGKVLDDEPPVGLDYETVLADGRRRRARRHLGIVTAAVIGVVAIAGGAVAVTQYNASRVNAPAGPVDTESGCGGAGISGTPPSREELAESARLTEAFSKFTFPALPQRVSLSPAKLRFCTVTDGWQATVALLGPKGYRSLLIDVQPRRNELAGECGPPGAVAVDCTVSTVKDTATLRRTITPTRNANQPVVVNLDAWRLDGTIVRLLETGKELTSGAAPRVFSDDDLAKIALAPELKVNWTEPANRRPGVTSDARAVELTKALAQAFTLPQGMRAEAMPNAPAAALAFYASYGTYKLNADLIDGRGKGNLSVVLSPPVPGKVVPDTCDRNACEIVSLTNGRTGALYRIADGSIARMQLSTMTEDGTQVAVMVSNQSLAAGRTSGPSRPETPLTREDLISIANTPGLGW